jgi:hypothetical protein
MQRIVGHGSVDGGAIASKIFGYAADSWPRISRQKIKYQSAEIFILKNIYFESITALFN